ncbi:MAG: ABC transporter permease [Cyclobacteriaceae bacterium]|nr:ABC transporter permease [Cyclobacteriaceae bacterium]
MLWNFIKVALRNLVKYRFFSFINVFGLAISMSVCLLLVLMLHDLKQYDRFHEKRDSIYRIISNDANPIPVGTTPVPLAGDLTDNYTIAAKTVKLQIGVGGDIAYKNNKVTVRGFFTEPSFFEVFSFALTQGNPATALQKPNSIVLSKKKAELLFGNTDPLGKVVEFYDRGLLYLEISGFDKTPVSWGQFVVTGIIDTENYKSHLKFDALVSSPTFTSLMKERKVYWGEENWQSWDNYNTCFTYVLLDDDKTEKDLSIALSDIVNRHYEDREEKKEYTLSSQSILDITPGKFINNPTQFTLPLEGFYFLSFLAALIMLSACLNYTNLSVARALTRVKEVGVRKVTGASRSNLIVQFMGESIITALFALFIGILVVFMLKPAFLGLWVNKFLNFTLAPDYSIFGLFLLFALLIGIISGIFPALYLSKHQPIKIFSKLVSTKTGKFGLIKALTVSQFVISLFFIASSILVYKQLNHYLNFKYGFTTENIINIELQGNDPAQMINEFSSIAGVERISACEHIPATGINNALGLRHPGSEEEYVNYARISVDSGFINNLGLKLLTGNNFSPDYNISGRQHIIINESMVNELGFSTPEDALDYTLEAMGDWPDVQVIGVVENFRHKLPMAEEKIGPLLLINLERDFSYLNVKVASTDLMGVVENISNKWTQIDPDHPFKYDFFDDQMAATHQVFTDLVAIVGFVAFLSITIACLGLLGIATYTVERRTKEIGIRKIFGAGELTITTLLSKGFVMLLVISVLIAAPLTYFINNTWLEFMANRVAFNWQSVIISAGILLLLGLITIATQTLHASRANPVDSLRNE